MHSCESARIICVSRLSARETVSSELNTFDFIDFSQPVSVAQRFSVSFRQDKEIANLSSSKVIRASWNKGGDCY